MIIEEYIGKEIDSLDRSIVATPKTRENLDAFARANYGSTDMVLIQMAVQYGYKLALENVSDELQTQHEQ
jgi:hypothetical protein